MSAAIKVENLSKAYQLGQIGTGTISRDVERWYARVRGKEDPYLKIGESNNQNTRSERDIVWSLKDINFEIEQGDAVGIIGRNGAGKSTLLKILSKVTAPTTGKISGKGRIASLLEVGTGFHPELSGRENIFLNGAILGMRKKEIQRKLEEIVDFAGIERYLDTPVKRYSSGMYVRLAFAVAAHLESEILIVDEVLAVGDAEFQKKCLGKMGEVSKGEGRTILFVSHDMTSIKNLCKKSILLMNGSVNRYDNSEKTIQHYLQGVKPLNTIWERESIPNTEAFFLRAYITDIYNRTISMVDNSLQNFLNLEVYINENESVSTIAFLINSLNGTPIFCSHDYDCEKPTYFNNKNLFSIPLPNFLMPGTYTINLGINGQGFHGIDDLREVLIFDVIGNSPYVNPLNDQRGGLIYYPLQWSNITKF